MTAQLHTLNPDAATMRTVLGHFATGLTIVTAMDTEDGRATPVGMACNSFTSVSLDPPLVLFCVGKTAHLGRLIHAASGFSVNILQREQQQLSTYFAGRGQQEPPPPFTFIPWEGGPLLDGSLAALGCAIETIYEGGDHWIVLGRVLSLYRSHSATPLVFRSGRYTDLASPETV
jgi:3-hydroxy-9,10-secoandrosta-1,3,5(10)-triene-9,17-dione monooxygenase reductase component